MVSENWYPEIDMDECVNCRKCVDSCECGVFEVINDRVMVAYPEECTWECTKCESTCPKKSISYQLEMN